MRTSASTVIDFWFNEIQPKQWWVKDPDFDELLRRRFGETLKQASVCELSEWRSSAEGRLAEIIVLDQFSRNIYRNSPGAFAQDPLALALAQEAVQNDALTELDHIDKRTFLLMPYMHSESKVIHQAGVELFKEYTPENNYEFELKHKAIVDRFGRYPHRNTILGRASSVEETEFLKLPGSGF
ncbi:MAG: DUF924 domain-containing protein [Thalassolituus maritimus]|uniref:Uncharacterized conserved protein, DUF924 family n=1 Tax=Thalassolituus maritimus TaxID=484498 RepID=A0A1N7KW25_9GAMM|nr:DUF924 family protein [Thalassolituus maritimus]TPD55576.1 MAG: DUF924 domain-containing protein [Thalassolituus maritimus]SIS65803.1 Uncharacterized conserved protein, DUF924 family [Thalassolituus maritimus]